MTAIRQGRLCRCARALSSEVFPLPARAEMIHLLVDGSLQHGDQLTAADETELALT
jgi:hypothetical protein